MNSSLKRIAAARASSCWRRWACWHRRRTRNPISRSSSMTQSKTLSNFLRDPDMTWLQNNIGRAKAVLIAPADRQGRLHLRRLGRPCRAGRA